MKLVIKQPVYAAALAVCSLSPWAVAQDAKAAAKPGTTPEYCSISHVVGAAVRMGPGTEAQRKAQREGEVAEQPKGKIDDVIVDSRTGDLHYAVISFGGFIGIGDKTVAVPCSSLTWIPAHERFEIAATEDQLRALPAFDLGRARESGLDAACVVVEQQWRARPQPGESGKPADAKPADAKEASAPKAAKPLAGTTFVEVPTCFICATEIDDFPVYATAEKFGTVRDLFVDRGQRRVTLAVVNRGATLGIGGTDYLVPYRSLHLCTSGKERLHCMTCKADCVTAAVVYEKPKDGIVDPVAAKRALDGSTFDKDAGGAKVQ